MELYSIIDASKKLSVSTNTTYRMIKEKELGHTLVRGKIRISQHHIDAYVRKNEILPNPKDTEEFYNKIFKGGISMNVQTGTETSKGRWVVGDLGCVYVPSWRDKKTGKVCYRVQRAKNPKIGKKFPSYYLCYYNEKGERVQEKAKGCFNLKQAIAKLIETITKNGIGNGNGNSTDGLKEITLDEFWEKIKERGVPEDTIKAYKYSITKCISPNTLLSNITVEDVENYISYMNSRNNTQVTINKRLQSLRKLLDEANDRDYRLHNGRNPVRKSLFYPVQKKKESDTPIFTKEQIRDLFLFFEPHVHATCSLSLLVGMRKGEALDLKLDEIVFNGKEESYITLQPERTKENMKKVIPLNWTSGLYELIMDLKKQHNQIKDSEFEKKSDKEFLILYQNSKGKWTHPTKIETNFNHAMEKAGLKGNGLKFHSFRHTHITKMHEEDRNPLDIAKVTGHHSLSMTGYYSHITPESLCKKVTRTGTGLTQPSFEIPLHMGK